MTFDRQQREGQRIVMQMIGRGLRAFYALEMQLSPELQAFLQRLDEQQEQNR